MLIAIGAAYFIVAVSFRSYGEPILILLAAIPFCYCGMIIGHMVMGATISLLSLLGMFAAAGVMMERSLQAQWLIPIGISLAFGVMFALLVTLMLVPALYGIGADIRRIFVYLFKGIPPESFTSKIEHYEEKGVKLAKQRTA